MTGRLTIPVMVAGGGTVGLAAGMFLGRWGVPALVVERHDALSRHPRATAVGQRTREIFRTLGIEQQVLDAGQTFAVGGKIAVERLAGTDLSALPRGRRPRAAQAGLADRFSPAEPGGPCSQDRLDPILLRALQETGTDFRFGTALESFRPDDQGVRAVLLDRASGERIEVRADYLIGADGADSAIREQLGIGTSGPGALGDHVVNILFRADLHELIDGQEFTVCEITNDQVHGGLLPIDKDGSVWVFHTEYDPSRESAADFPPERCREIVRAAIGLPDLPVEILNVLPWRMAAQVADRYRDGRVFLIGDAAHVVPPMGGFGMNTGIADAHNLAWKLAAVRRGAGPGLLDTYEQERRPVALSAMDQVLLRMSHPTLHWDHDAVEERARLGMAHAMVMHLAYRYDSDAVLGGSLELPSLEDVEADLDGSPGTRVPHLWLGPGDRRLSTLDLIGARFTLLAGPDGRPWCDQARGLEVPMNVHRLTPAVETATDVFDPDGRWPRTAGIEAGGALLIRPDGFVAWRAERGPAETTATLAEVVDRILDRRATPPVLPGCHSGSPDSLRERSMGMSSVDDQRAEQIRAVTAIREIALSAGFAAALRAVTQLGVADQIGTEPISLAALASRLNLDPDALRRLMGAVIANGVFAAESGGSWDQPSYRHTTASRLLRSDASRSLRYMVLWATEPWTWEVWPHLAEAVRTGKGGFTESHGKEFFTWLHEDAPESAAVFDRAMTQSSALSAEAISAGLDLSAAASVVDIAGGQGLLLSTLLERNPHLRGTLLDLPDVVNSADVRLRPGGALAGRVELRPGDCRVEVAVDVDVYLLKNILEWDDDSTVTALRNVVRAAKPGARVVVIENLVDDSPEMRFTTSMDLLLLLNVDGRKHSKDGLTALMERAGLEVTDVRRVGPYLHLFDAIVPSAR